MPGAQVLTPVKILYISHLHPEEGALLENMGGMQRVSMQLVDALSQRDDVVLTTEILHANWEGIAAQTFKFTIELLFRIPRLVVDHDIDVVLFSSMVTASLAPLIRGRVEVPLVAINHGRDVTLPVAPYQAYLKKVFAALDSTVSVSTATRQECLNRGMNPETAFVLPNGLPVGSQASSPDRNVARAELHSRYSIPKDGRLILSVGRHVKRKGHQWFIEQVLPKVTVPCEVVFVGDGPETSVIKSLIESNASLGNVHILGRIDDAALTVAYDAADVFVMPNIPVSGDMEGFGIVMIEANLRGVPVVAARLEGITDVVADGVNGYLVEPLNADIFAEKVNAIASQPDLFRAERVSQHVVDTFGWETIASDYVGLLRETVERRQGNLAFV